MLTFIGLTIIDVELTIALAIFAGITELIPIIGPWIGALPALLMAAASGDPEKSHLGRPALRAGAAAGEQPAGATHPEPGRGPPSRDHHPAAGGRGRRSSASSACWWSSRSPRCCGSCSGTPTAACAVPSRTSRSPSPTPRATSTSCRRSISCRRSSDPETNRRRAIAPRRRRLRTRAPRRRRAAGLLHRDVGDVEPGTLRAPRKRTDRRARAPCPPSGPRSEAGRPADSHRPITPPRAVSSSAQNAASPRKPGFVRSSARASSQTPTHARPHSSRDANRVSSRNIATTLPASMSSLLRTQAGRARE